MERITDKYVFFWGAEFSDWYECEFIYCRYLFKNTEQAFMWEKARFFGDHEIAKLILKSPDPKINKDLGRRVKNFNAEKWMEYCYVYMLAVNYAKYNQNEGLKNTLLSTGNKTIVEASPYDKIWGIGLHWNNDDCLDETKWQGMNLLGKVLMEVREELR